MQEAAQAELVRGRLSGIFAKQPVPGRVKTRLVPPLSPEGAAHLALAMLDDAVGRGSAREAASRSRLVFAPEEAEPWFRERYGARLELAPQRGAGLGERLAQFFEQALAESGVRTVLAVGTDAPLVPAARLAEAHTALEAGADLVLGPDRGGGYYLVGLRAPAARLFLDVPMSTPTMCAATEALARRLGLAVMRLAPEDDVDVPADLLALAERLLHAPPGESCLAGATRAALRALQFPA
jgi:hypothetical protein